MQSGFYDHYTPLKSCLQTSSVSYYVPYLMPEPHNLVSPLSSLSSTLLGFIFPKERFDYFSPFLKNDKRFPLSIGKKVQISKYGCFPKPFTPHPNPGHWFRLSAMSCLFPSAPWIFIASVAFFCPGLQECSFPQCLSFEILLILKNQLYCHFSKLLQMLSGRINHSFPFVHLTFCSPNE